MNEQCIEWRGLRFSTGYGRLTNSERLRTGHLYAHRWLYEQFRGPIPSGYVVMHTCDNPPCVNPAHLRCGTVRDNIRDASAKKRLARQRNTVCVRGHAYTESNTQRYNGKRQCRLCWNAGQRRRYRERKARCG